MIIDPLHMEAMAFNDGKSNYKLPESQLSLKALVIPVLSLTD